MPGAFAHMIAAEKTRQLAEGNESHTIVRNTLKFPQWLQAGAVGPDFPYLHHISSHDESDSWADLMHYDKTGDVVRIGAQWLADYSDDRNNAEFGRAVSWLAGYLSHVVLDASIHPVVRAIVGEYEQNVKQHRICEMYMDSYIFYETYGYELVNDEWIDFLRHVTDSSGTGLDRSIKLIWDFMLHKTYPNEYKKNKPNFDAWHKGYINALDLVDNKLIIFRHLASKNGFIYTNSDEIPDSDMNLYIRQAKTPKNNRFQMSTMHYNEIFSFAVDNVVRYWKMLNDAIDGTVSTDLPELPNWNLDKGTIDLAGEGDATLWA